jgi:hypothetical protein
VDDTIVVIGPSCTEIIQPEEGESEGCRPGTYRAAVFDLTKRTWREVKVPSGLSKFGAFTSGEGRITNALGATSGGRAVFEVGPPVFLGGNMEYWSYSPSRDEWADLGSPGIRPEAACVAGDQLVVATAKYLNNGVVKDDSPFRHLTPGGSASGGPGDGWVEPSIVSLSVDHPGFWAESAPASDVMIKLGDPKLSCMGDSALVFGGDRTNVRRFDLTSGAWSTPALPPAGPTPFNTDARLWTGTELLLRSETATLPGGSSAYDPATNSWRAVTGVPPGLSNASWSGSAVVGYSEPLDGAKAGIYWYPVG